MRSSHTRPLRGWVRRGRCSRSETLPTVSQVRAPGEPVCPGSVTAHCSLLSDSYGMAIFPALASTVLATSLLFAQELSSACNLLGSVTWLCAQSRPYYLDKQPNVDFSHKERFYFGGLQYQIWWPQQSGICNGGAGCRGTITW